MNQETESLGLINEIKSWFFTYNLIILAGGETLGRLVYAIAFIHLTRVLQPALYGEVELVLALTLLLVVISELGLKALGAREIAGQPDHAEPLVKPIILMQLWFTIILFLLISLVAIILPLTKTFTWLLVGYGASLLAYPFLLNWIFQGRNQMTWVAIPQLLRQGVFAVLVIVFVNQPDHVLRVPLIELVAIGLAVFLNLVVFRRSGGRIKISVGKSWDPRLLLDALPIGLSQSIWAVRMYLPTVILGLLAGQTAVGYFGVSHRIVTVLLAMLAVYFVNIFPSMSHAAYQSHELLVSLLNQSLQFLMWPSLAFGFLTTFFAPQIIEIIYGTQYVNAQSVSVFMVLVWLFPIMVWRGNARYALIAMKHQRQELWCSLIGVALLLGSLPPLVSSLGPLGASVAMIFSESVGALLTWWVLKRFLPTIRATYSLAQLPSLALFVSRRSIAQ